LNIRSSLDLVLLLGELVDELVKPLPRLPKRIAALLLHVARLSFDVLGQSVQSRPSTRDRLACHCFAIDVRGCRVPQAVIDLTQSSIGGVLKDSEVPSGAP
jgi:hypothetical protein